MLRNYYTIALRALWRSKIHSSINILGLSLGIACCILIVLFVRDEWTFDKFHKKANRIYRVYSRENWGENQDFFNTVTPFPMGPALKENFPEVELQVRFNNIGTQVKSGDQTFSEQVSVIGKDFFKVFDFPSVEGNADEAMQSQHAVILTKRQAQKYFGEASAIDRPVLIQLGEKFDDFIVKAVVDNPPVNSSIQFDILISDLNYPKLYSERALTSAWFNINPETYVLLQEDTRPETVVAKFPSVFRTILGEENFEKSKYAPGLQPFTDIHLNPSFPVGIAPVSDPKYAYILSAIAGLILSVACINFVTLSVGRSIKRSKEVGIRKAVGAARKQILFQFVGEAVLITFVSMIVGMVLAVLALPLFNSLAGKQMTFPFDWFMAGILVLLLVVIGMIAGSYPAFVLSGFKPMTILRGTGQGGGDRQTLRKVLVGVQLLLSIFLISSTLIMQNQLNYLRNKNLGFDKEQLAVVQLQIARTGSLSERVKRGFEKAQQFKDELADFPDIVSVCGSSHDFGNGAWTSIGYTDDNGTYRNFDMNVVDAEYLRTLRIKLKQGRDFEESNPSDLRRSIIVNESFIKEMGWTDGIGKRIPGKGFADHEVIGVMEDFNYASLYTRVTPLVLVMNPDIVLSGSENINIDNSPLPKLLVRISPGQLTVAMDHLKNVWEKISAGEPWQYSFVDQSIARLYKNDQNLGKIVSVATLLSILIGGLGLYGLASLAMQGRTKEISIRKVMGATQKSLLVLLSRDYVILVMTSLILSAPLTVYVMQQWLTSFEYRVPIGWGVFILAGSLAFLVMIVAIGFEALKTAWTQPAEALKHE